MSLVSKVSYPFRLIFLVLRTFFHVITNPEIAAVAFRNLENQALRRNLTLLGIVIGIAAIVTLFMVGEGLNASIQQSFEGLGLNNIFVEPGGTMSATMFSKLSENDQKIIERIPFVEKVIPFYETSVIAKKGNEEISLMVMGLLPEDFEYMEEIGFLDLSQGRFLTDNDQYALVVYDNFLTDAFSSDLKLRQSVEINGKKFKIVGISKQSDMGFGTFGFFNMGYTSQNVVKDFLGEKDPAEFAVKVTGKEHVSEVARKIEQDLERDHGEKNFTVFTTEGLLTSAVQVLGVIQIFVVAITAIALLVGGIGIMNTMFMAVTERTREIGTMKAIGATDELIRSIFLAEAGIVGAIGGAIGTGFGVILAWIVTRLAANAGFELAFVLNPVLLIGAVLFSFILGVVSGVAPAEKAIGLDPVEAIRYE
ncbi:MAG: ABC transporter permease [Candidatus Micrarchaeota archaeon]